MEKWIAGVLPLRKYPTAKIAAHTIRTPITYAVSVFKDFSTDFTFPYRNRRFSFGTGKLGELAGFASAVILALVALFIGYECFARIIQPVAPFPRSPADNP